MDEDLTVTLTQAEATAILGLRGYLRWVSPASTRALVASALKKVEGGRRLGSPPSDFSLNGVFKEEDAQDD
jgi:hypothetical protein